MALNLKNVNFFQKHSKAAYKFAGQAVLILERLSVIMKDYLLKPLIEKIKEQDMSAFPLIFDEFKRLINFYAAKLRYEDAASDLTLFLIELLYTIRLSKFEDNESDDIKRYIAVSIKNKYFSLSANHFNKEKYNDDFYDGYDVFYEDFLGRIFLDDSLKSLNDEQKIIIIYRYIYGYSIADIGQITNLSRQTVNKKKNQALKILREEFLKNETILL